MNFEGPSCEALYYRRSLITHLLSSLRHLFIFHRMTSASILHLLSSTVDLLASLLNSDKQTVLNHMHGIYCAWVVNCWQSCCNIFCWCQTYLHTIQTLFLVFSDGLPCEGPQNNRRAGIDRCGLTTTPEHSYYKPPAHLLSAANKICEDLGFWGSAPFSRNLLTSHKLVGMIILDQARVPSHNLSSGLRGRRILIYIYI